MLVQIFLSSETTSFVIPSLIQPYKNINWAPTVCLQLWNLNLSQMYECVIQIAEVSNVGMKYSGENMLGHDWISPPNSFETLYSPL